MRARCIASNLRCSRMYSTLEKWPGDVAETPHRRQPGVDIDNIHGCRFLPSVLAFMFIPYAHSLTKCVNLKSTSHHPSP